MTSVYNVNHLTNDNIEYPLTLVNETITSEDIVNPVFEDKYITLGVSGSTNSTTLLAGMDSLQIIDENFNLRNAEYVSIFGIDLPTINPAAVISAEIYLCKNTTTNNPNRNPTVYLDKITSNISYDNIGGTSTYSSTSITSGMRTNQSYTFDITDEIEDSLTSGSELLLALSGSSTGYASFYSSEASSTTIPYISIVVDSSVIGATPFGNAPAYTAVNSIAINCFGYVLMVNEALEIGLPKVSFTEMYGQIESICASKSYSIRQIPSNDSYIYADERRIAFRYDLEVADVWHFVMQNSDGRWSGKPGFGYSIQFSYGQTPDDDLIWGNSNSGFYDEDTYYFAIKSI